MAKSIKKSSPSGTAPRKKQKTRGNLEGISRIHSAQELNESLQARVLKRTAQRDEAKRKLSETRNTFYTLFQDNPIPLALTRITDDAFINVNVAFLNYFDLRLEQVIGHTAEELKLGLELHAYTSLLDQLQKGGGVRIFERGLRLPSGKNVTILASLQYLCIDAMEAILSAFIDITERKQAEEMLRNMVDAAPDATVVIDEAGNIVLVNKQLENVFGYARGDLIGKPLSTLIPKRFQKIHPQHRLRYFDEPRLRQISSGLKLYGQRRDGSEFPVEISLSPLKTPDGMLAMAAIRDITERMEAERKMRQLTALLSEAEQSERQRISQLLHDNLQQRLFALKVHLPRLEEAYSQGNREAMRKALTEMDEGLTETIAITRKLSVEISPLIPPDEDLAGALTTLVIEMQKQYGLDVALKINGLETNLDNSLRMLLFQAVRELLFNVVKHAEDLQAAVTLERMDDQLRVTVSDEGKGFDPVAVIHDPDNAHGLLGIRQRLELMGCQMEIISSPGAGTRVVIYCPHSS